jgi:hypothetical protein
MDSQRVRRPWQWFSPCTGCTLALFPCVLIGPRKPPIEVGNVKSGFLQKFIHFSRSFIHVSWVAFPPG